MSFFCKQEIAERVRQLREDIGLSPGELARKAGLQTHTIIRIEDGYGCTVQTMQQLCAALEADIAKVVGSVRE